MNSATAKLFVMTVAAAVVAGLLVGYLTTQSRTVRRLVGG